MSFFDDVKKTAGKLSDSAKKTYNINKLNLKISTYKKEINLEYCKIGKLVFEGHEKNKPINTEQLDMYFNSISMRKSKISDFEKRISKIKDDADTEVEEVFYEPKYTRLNKSANDLKVIRTEEGVKFIRICPECSCSNEPDNAICSECGYEFSQKAVDENSSSDIDKKTNEN